MNNRFERQFAERMKSNYEPGTRLELISMDDPYSKIPPGTRGTVMCVDDIGTIHVKWDNGSGLGLVPGEDAFRRLTPAEIEEETNSVVEQDGGMAVGYLLLSSRSTEKMPQGSASIMPLVGWICLVPMRRKLQNPSVFRIQISSGMPHSITKERTRISI